MSAPTILQVMADPQIWGGWFKRTETWKPWRTFLACLFGLPLSDEGLDLFRACTARAAPPEGGLTEAWLVCGRRAGKSFILALIAVYLAVFRNWKPFLSPGEIGTIKIIAVDKRQARTIHRYCRALLTKVPLFAELIERDGDDEIILINNIVIEIQAASFRSVRGYTVIAGLCDEIAYFRSDETSSNPDSEIIAALRPAMATVPGAMLLCASSPYAKRGELWNAYRRWHGKDDAPALIWHADTRTMNPTVSERVIAEAMAEDPAKAGAEYLAQFRSDIESYISREVVEAAVVPGRHELPYMSGVHDVAFVDPSGGAADSMTLAICHCDKDGRAVLDLAREVRPPFSPESVVDEFAGTLRAYRISRVRGDRYGGVWCQEPFKKRGITYEISDKSKSDLYQAFLPVINSGKVELLDHTRLVAQLCSLERRTARGGKDSIDHPSGSGWRDDIANSVCGAAVLAASKPGPMKISPEFMARVRALPPRHRDRALQGPGFAGVDRYALWQRLGGR